MKLRNYKPKRVLDNMDPDGTYYTIAGRAPNLVAGVYTNDTDSLIEERNFKTKNDALLWLSDFYPDATEL